MARILNYTNKHSLGKMTGKLYIKLKSKKIIDNRQIRVYIIDM